MQLVYTESHLGTKFNVNAKTKKEHNHVLNIVKCAMINCSKSYNDETVGSLIEWVTSKKDKYSYIFEHLDAVTGNLKTTVARKLFFAML